MRARRTFTNTCGRRRHAARPAPTSARRCRRSRSPTIKPVSTPSPVVARSANTMWPDCSPPIARSCSAIAVVTLRSPTGVSTISTPAACQRAPQAEVRHHGDRDRVVAQHPALVPVERGHHHQLIAVDELAALVDREHAVRVAVEREAEIGAARPHRGLQLLRMRRAATGVDVPAVGIGVQHVDARARVAQRARPELRRRPVRAVDHHVQPVERAPESAPSRCATYASISPAATGVTESAANRLCDAGSARTSRMRAELGLDRGLDVSGTSLRPSGPTIFTPLSFQGLWLADTIAAGSTAPLREERDRGRGRDAQRPDPARPRPRGPASRSASIRGPDSRVSRPIEERSGAQHPRRGRDRARRPMVR